MNSWNEWTTGGGQVNASLTVKTSGKGGPERMISGEVAQQIAIDVGNNTPPDKSRLHYGPEELAFRKGVEERFAAYRKIYPDAIMDVKE